jgi:hypothetical protein
MGTGERSIRSYLDGEVSLEPRIRRELVSLGTASPTGGRSGRSSLIACSCCLRVLRDERWIPAETVIRDRRSFECDDEPPRFESVLCPICTLAIQLRRAQTRIPRPGAIVPSSGRR